MSFPCTQSALGHAPADARHGLPDAYCEAVIRAIRPVRLPLMGEPRPVSKDPVSDSSRAKGEASLPLCCFEADTVDRHTIAVASRASMA
jgi:hypothetical protein